MVYISNRRIVVGPRKAETVLSVLPGSEAVRNYAIELIERFELANERLGHKRKSAEAFRHAIEQAPNGKIYEAFQSSRGAVIPRYPTGDAVDLGGLLKTAMLKILDSESRPS